MNNQPKDVEEIEKIIEKVLLERIKLIGEEEQIYTGYSNALIKEIALEVQSYLTIQTEQRVGEYRRIAELISSIYYYGDFVAETPSERELEGLLREVNLWPTSEDLIVERTAEYEALSNQPKDVEDLIYHAIQDEVAGEMWYESRQNEDRLQKLLQNLEKRLLHDLTTHTDKRVSELHQEVKSLEQSWMSLKDEYSSLCRALGFEGDAWFGDPKVPHAEIIAKAKELIQEAKQADKRVREDRLSLFERLHKRFMATKNPEVMDIIEELQREVLSDQPKDHD